jgi:hypothetical protein
MKPIVFGAVCALAIACASGAPASEKRCGWLDNPSPANLFLDDKDGEWVIASMGEAAGPNAIGADDVPWENDCACLVVDTDKKSQRIVRIYSTQIEPKAKCRADKSLPKPD